MYEGSAVWALWHESLKRVFASGLYPVAKVGADEFAGGDSAQCGFVARDGLFLNFGCGEFSSLEYRVAIWAIDA